VPAARLGPAITNSAASRALRRLAAPAVGGGAALLLLAGCSAGSPTAAGTPGASRPQSAGQVATAPSGLGSLGGLG